jgi:nitrilase
LLEEAAAGGARLVSFPETWVPGYREWVWRLRPGEDAAEGRCWVLGNGTAMRGKDIPKDFPQRAKLFPDLEAWYNPGDSVIVDPRGKIVAGPLTESHGILYAECDPVVASAAKRTLDVAGHYGRPDIFKLEVNREILAPIDFG